MGQLKRFVLPRRVDPIALVVRSAREVLNSRVFMTCGDRAATIPTRDTSDRAHASFAEDGLLRPGAAVPNAKPRRYHQSQITSAGVSFDSAFDATYQRAKRLEGIPGIGSDSFTRERLIVSREVPAPRSVRPLG